MRGVSSTCIRSGRRSHWRTVSQKLLRRPEMQVQLPDVSQNSTHAPHYAPRHNHQKPRRRCREKRVYANLPKTSFPRGKSLKGSRSLQNSSSSSPSADWMTEPCCVFGMPVNPRPAPKPTNSVLIPSEAMPSCQGGSRYTCSWPN